MQVFGASCDQFVTISITLLSEGWVCAQCTQTSVIQVGFLLAPSCFLGPNLTSWVGAGGCLSIFAGRILIFLKQRVERARRQRRLAGSRSRCPPERSPGFGGSPATAGVLAVRQDPCKDPNLLEPPSVLSNWVSRKNTERSFRIQHWLASPINATPRPET